MSAKDGGPAFPERRRIQRAGYPTNEYEPVPGMALRDWFAGQAMPECIRVAADKTPGPDPLLSKVFEKAGTYAYFAADALLKARG